MKIVRLILCFPILDLLFGWLSYNFNFSPLQFRAFAKQNSNLNPPKQPRSSHLSRSSDLKFLRLDSSGQRKSLQDYMQTKRRQILPIESNSGVNSLPDRQSLQSERSYLSNWITNIRGFCEVYFTFYIFFSWIMYAQLKFKCPRGRTSFTRRLS